MITGASRKPFSAVRSPVVPLNENVVARGDQRAVDQLRDERDVVQAVRDAAVGRVVAADDAGDPHRLRLRGGALGHGRVHGELGGPRGGRDRGGEERLRRSQARRCRGRACPGRSRSRRPRAPRSARRPGRARRSCAACRTRPRLRHRRSSSRVAPSVGSESSSAIRQRGSFQRVPSYSSRTGAESAVTACRRAIARSAAVDLDRVDADGQRHGQASVEARERADDRRLSSVAVERAAVLAGHDLDLEAAPDELGLDVLPVDRARQRGDLEVERAGVGLDGRSDLLAEEARLQPAGSRAPARSPRPRAKPSRAPSPSRPRRRGSWP